MASCLCAGRGEEFDVLEVDQVVEAEVSGHLPYGRIALEFTRYSERKMVVLQTRAGVLVSTSVILVLMSYPTGMRGKSYP